MLKKKFGLDITIFYPMIALYDSASNNLHWKFCICLTGSPSLEKEGGGGGGLLLTSITDLRKLKELLQGFVDFYFKNYFSYKPLNYKSHDPLPDVTSIA